MRDRPVEDQPACRQMGEETVIRESASAEDSTDGPPRHRPPRPVLETTPRRREPRPLVSGTALVDELHRGFDQRLAAMFSAAGPMITTNNAGKMQKTIGMSILTGAFCARSCAS